MVRRAGTVPVLLAVGFFTLASVSAGSTTVRRCQASDFKLSQGPGASALAHFRQTVRLQNVTKTTCSMMGWVKVKLLNAHDNVLASQEQQISTDTFGTSPKPTVKVKPGGGASFAIDTTAPATSCRHSKRIAVVPPGGQGSARLKMAVLACTHFSVMPVQPDNHAVHP